jgi:hypothetical protein
LSDRRCARHGREGAILINRLEKQNVVGRAVAVEVDIQLDVGCLTANAGRLYVSGIGEIGQRCQQRAVEGTGDESRRIVAVGADDLLQTAGSQRRRADTGDELLARTRGCRQRADIHAGGIVEIGELPTVEVAIRHRHDGHQCPLLESFNR